MGIAARRRAKGLNQQELAAALGVYTNTVSRWEQGVRRVSVSLQKIAKVLGVEVEDLPLPATDVRAAQPPDVYDQAPPSDLERARSKPKTRR